MCGICGYVESDRPWPRQTLEAMNAVQAHRGPDANGVITFENGPVFCGLGHTRLSIIDLAGGVQPMTNEDGTIWITYNGEVYNHRELRTDLEGRGHRYKTNSDTETIIHLYEEYGPDCVQHLRGMFAFAIWDDRQKKFFAARDRLGIKPFYYTFQNGRLIFASEIKTIFESGKVRSQLAETMLPEYLTFGYITGASTLFSGVQKLLPGHYLVCHNGYISTHQYWDVAFGAKDCKEPSEQIQNVADLFQKSVQLRLMSDVPLGMFLSGGLDSSAIACTMAQLHPTRIKAFTVDFGQDYFSEAGFAEIVADANNMELHKVVVTARDFVDVLDKLIWHNDLPIHFPASIPLYFISLEAANHVKVVLTGEGSDELFGGYGRYRTSMINMRLAGILGGTIPDGVRSFFRKNAWSLPLPLKLKKAIAHSLLFHPSAVQHSIYDNFYGVFLQEDIQALTNGQIGHGQAGAYENYIGNFNAFPDEQTLNRMLYADMKTYLEELLMKQDKMSMATSVESRVPFLDHKLVELAATLPDNMKIRGRELKYVIKQACHKFLPQTTVQRPKMGFPLPLAAWMREPLLNGLLKDTLLDARTRDRGLFYPDYVNRLIQEHESNRRDHSQKLWQLLNFELWSRKFLDAK
ncbi:asparagine synthase (glutamine-hydrolyzing) [Desulfobulbus alkaliphilus]|uniref:asparagine synthase (glutamine-hydrolyzing) n=1 Tax=Desulfobulbus alkaliphilus TaxID=869814 RepID=UPI001964B797|nr:asparagine synthase (glutamine-hydrolyzing) [Desulfobulbus alkaliphilus]MBM9538527.1 asparagine synthase (glutamine-hydrolyzing) [Desulfobulbus alkaliphilus]